MADSTVQWILKLVNQVSAPAKEAAKDTKALAQEQQDQAKSSGKAAEGLARLGGALSIVSPQLGSLVLDAGKAAGATKSLLDASAATGISMGAIGVAMGAVVGVVATLGLAYAGLTADSREAAKVQAIVADGMKGVEERATATGRSILQLQLVTEGATAAETAHALALYDAEAAYRKATAGAKELVEANNKILAPKELIPSTWVEATGRLSRGMGDLADAIDRVDGGISGLANGPSKSGVFGFLTLGVDGLTTSTADLQKESYGAIGTMIQQKVAILSGVAATEQAKAATDAFTAAQKDAKAHADALAKSILDQAAAYRKQQEEARASAIKTGGDEAAQRGLDYLKERIALEEQAKEAAADAAAAAIFDANQAKEAAAAWRSALGASALGAAGTAVSFAQNPIGTIGSSTGPWGAIVVGLMTAITNLDDTLNGPNGLAQFGKDFRRELRHGGEDVAKFIVDAVGRIDPAALIIEFVTDLIKGLVDGLPTMMQEAARNIGPVAAALVRGIVVGAPEIVAGLITALADPETWTAVVDAFVDGFTDAFSGMGTDAANNQKTFDEDAKKNQQNFDNAARGIQQWITGTHADGADYVDKTGLYVLHRGEVVNTAARQQAASGGGMSTGSAKLRGMGGRLFLEIDADSVSDAFDQLRGRGYTLGTP